MSYEAFQEVLSGNDMELNDQVLITIMRRYDLAKDGNSSWVELTMLGA